MPLIGIFSSVGIRIAQGLTAVGLYNVVEMLTPEEETHPPQFNPHAYAALGVLGSVSAYWGYKHFTRPKRRRRRYR